MGIGVLNAHDALALGVSGPMLRAAGVAYDVRKFLPYSSYEKFDFDVPTRTEADCYARYLVRLAEMRESVKIVRQAMERIPPSGPIQADAPGIVLPAARDDEDRNGSAHLSLQDFHRGLRAARGRGLPAHRIAARRTGLVRGQRRLAETRPACTCAPLPSCNLQALPKLSEGSLVADLIACIGRIDIVLGEVDR